MKAPTLCERTRALLAEHDPAALEDDEAYGEEALAVLIRFEEMQGPGDCSRILYEEIERSFGGLAGKRESYAALGGALWQLRSGN